MDALATPDVYAVLTKPGTLKIQHMLPSSIESIWSYLTESELRRKWLAAGTMELRTGAPFELVWRNDELSETQGKRPPGFAAEQRMKSRILECMPPHTLSFTWGDSGEVTFKLEPEARKTLLTIIHGGLGDLESSATIAAGWHMHLNILFNRLTDTPPAPFWDGWSRLKDEYVKQFSPS